MPPPDPADAPTPRPGTPDASGNTERGAPEGPELTERSTTMVYRRAPRIAVFLVLGAVLGAVMGIVAGVLGSGNVQYTTGQIIGFMLVVGALVGLAVGAVAAVVIDRFTVRRAREVEARAESSRRRRAATQDDSETNSAHDAVDDTAAPEDGGPRTQDTRETDPDAGDASHRAPKIGE